MTTGLKGLAGLPGLGIGGGGAAAPGASLLADYISRLTTAGGALTGVRLSALSTLFDILVSSGVAARIHYATLPGSPNTYTGSNVPVIDSLGVGNCTTNFVASEWNGTGFKGSGKNLTSPYIPSVRSTLDNTHLSTYFAENRAAGFSNVMGCQDGSGAFQMYADGYLVANQHSDGGDRVVQFSSPLAGLSLASRSSNTLHELRTPAGGGTDKLANSSTTARSGGLPATNFQMISSGNPTRILFSSVGLSISGPQYTALANALAAYTASRGVGIYSLFVDTAVLTNNSSDGVPYEQGFRFTIDVPGKITHLRFFKALSETSGHTGKIWNRDTQELITSVSFSGETSSGWQQQILSSPVNISPGINYAISININSHFVTGTEFYTAYEKNAFNIPVDAGVYALTPNIYPADVYFENYLIDLVFVED